MTNNISVTLLLDKIPAVKQLIIMNVFLRRASIWSVNQGSIIPVYQLPGFEALSLKAVANIIDSLIACWHRAIEMVKGGLTEYGYVGYSDISFLCWLIFSA